MSDRDINAEDALQVAHRALQKVMEFDGSLEERQAEFDDTIEELTEVKLRLSELDYSDLSLDTRSGSSTNSRSDAPL